jgi:predicted lysophospholipase L1 biosynthesis ABC-type transport system permease subunit
MPWFDFLGFPSGGLPEKDVGRRYLATAVISLAIVGALLISGWAFQHWNIIFAAIVCVTSVVIGFIGALWAVGRILPRKIHTGR